MKKARLQNSVLTYRNGIRGYDRWISMHINTKSVANKPIRVDFAGKSETTKFGTDLQKRNKRL
ncbi:hypothetical protein [Lacihabitans soyangensis]|uniref:hypothetical protein n=1 Tax=Lacihabitans soyangensis TaxID=869394 RepID=UPI0020CE2E8C|nr:hypothetical protein [Lacihabitans soyangensis]